MNLNKFKQLPIMGIVRGIDFNDTAPLVETAIEAGLKTLEITMNTEDAGSIIKEAIRVSNGRLTIGAGTVIDMKALHSALDAGATFIVLPTLVQDVVDYCTKNSIPVFPGALTPQEIYNAWNAGASMVKVFPSKLFGPEYFSEIKGPFNNIELLACGGVNPGNLCEYFKKGSDAIAFGGSTFKKELFEKKDYKTMLNSIKQYIYEYQNM